MLTPDILRAAARLALDNGTGPRTAACDAALLAQVDADHAWAEVHEWIRGDDLLLGDRGADVTLLLLLAEVYTDA